MEDFSELEGDPCQAVTQTDMSQDDSLVQTDLLTSGMKSGPHGSLFWPGITYLDMKRPPNFILGVCVSEIDYTTKKKKKMECCSDAVFF